MRQTGGLGISIAGGKGSTPYKGDDEVRSCAHRPPWFPAIRGLALSQPLGLRSPSAGCRHEAGFEFWGELNFRALQKAALRAGRVPLRRFGSKSSLGADHPPASWHMRLQRFEPSLSVQARSSSRTHGAWGPLGLRGPPRLCRTLGAQFLLLF